MENKEYMENKENMKLPNPASCSVATMNVATPHTKPEDMGPITKLSTMGFFSSLSTQTRCEVDFPPGSPRYKHTIKTI